jgi:hypothetical protein
VAWTQEVHSLEQSLNKKTETESDYKLNPKKLRLLHKAANENIPALPTTPPTRLLHSCRRRSPTPTKTADRRCTTTCSSLLHHLDGSAKPSACLVEEDPGTHSRSCPGVVDEPRSP